jgi:hypothetical protein
MKAHETAPPVARALSWRTVNITPVERSGRVLLGVAAVIAGLVLLIGVGSVLAGVLEVLLIAAGLDLAVTGALGHCPLYAKLGRTITGPQGN